MEKIEKSVKQMIDEKYEDLFAAEKKVADFIRNNLDEVALDNVSEIAEKSGASEATVVRTCKHLGYDGYYQMRLLLSRDLGKADKQQQSEHLNTSAKFFAYESSRVSNLANKITIENLLDAAKIILNSHIVHLIGVGNTVPVATDLGFRLERNGIRCIESTMPEQFYNHVALADSQDCVIAISRTGASTQVIHVVEMAVKKKMKVIAITGELNQSFVASADCVIHVEETPESNPVITKPDSHLLEYAVNDALIYVLRNLMEMRNREDFEVETNIEILLSEFKL